MWTIIYFWTQTNKKESQLPKFWICMKSSWDAKSWSPTTETGSTSQADNAFPSTICLSALNKHGQCKERQYWIHPAVIILGWQPPFPVLGAQVLTLPLWQLTRVWLTKHKHREHQKLLANNSPSHSQNFFQTAKAPPHQGFLSVFAAIKIWHPFVLLLGVLATYKRTMVQYWNKLSREAEETPSLDIFKTEQDKALSNPTYLSNKPCWEPHQPQTAHSRVPTQLYSSIFLLLL